ncbi:hypothetical protein F0231_05345 [Vibrio sp. RE86]|uniref:hypothetical protein n=1 Tax=Vibrio sp. RE86 TaxID=2607605 RepID=UPI00149354AA|nr:hypothetical protein [Vibrio sp. RE86]NOH79163.1 hypothetical protein [Vibrio sp. RE86]
MASPADYVAGGGSHTTLYGDLLVLVQRLIDPTILPPNTSLEGVGDEDWTKHGFVDSYMASGSESRNKITDDILEHYKSLYFDAEVVKEFGTGGVRLTYTLNENPDKDFHVLEAANEIEDVTRDKIIDFNNPDGFGYVSASGGNRTDTYHLPCQNMQAGDYRFYVSVQSEFETQESNLNIATPFDERDGFHRQCGECLIGDGYFNKIHELAVMGDALMGYTYHLDENLSIFWFELGSIDEDFRSTR